MRSTIFRAALASVALVLAVTTAYAQIEPIPGVDIIVKKKPGGALIPAGSTNPKGEIAISLMKGDYILEIDGKSLGMAIATIDPKGSRHTVHFMLGIPGQKPVLSGDYPFRGAGIDFSFTIPMGKSNYVGMLTLK